MTYHGPIPDLVGIPVHTPSSHEALPELPVPFWRRFQEVDALRRSSIEKAGMRPGTYTELDSELVGRITAVYCDLVDELTDNLRGLEAVYLCHRLYKRHEEMLGHILKAKHQTVPDIFRGNPARASRQVDELWKRLAPHTESIRWLIEIAVKHCDTPGIEPGNAKIEYLIALAHAIFEWDGAWEYIARGVVPHAVVVHEDFSLSPEPTRRTHRALTSYQRALEYYTVREDRRWADSTMVPTNGAGEVDIESVANLPEYKRLSQPLETERGYSMADWLRFSWGLLGSFEATEYCKLTKVSRLPRFLTGEWHVPKDRLMNLLVDHGLSRETVADVHMDNLRPAEYARRDSRLLRRPFVVLDYFGKPICIYGVELVEIYARTLPARLMTGRVGIPMQKRGPLTTAIRGIQSGLGKVFEKQLRERCMARGYQAEQGEKKSIGGEKLPQGRGFGPVDVFIVDRVHTRFVLAEAKDVGDDGTVAKKIRNEFIKFLGHIDKLNKQVAWFEERSDDLKAEYGISRNEDYSVEGVIVLNWPRIWMYTHTEPLPIVDERNFYRILESGERFQTVPVPT